jgi:hypothetical protein
MTFPAVADCGLQGLPHRLTAPQPRLRSLHLLRLGLPFRVLRGPPASALASASSLEIRTRRPSTVSPSCVHSQEQAPFGLAPTERPTCSDFVVSHHLDGLLHTMACGLIASHNRPGGSLRSTAARFTPSKVSPSPAAAPRHRGRCPLVVTTVSRSEDRSTKRLSQDW